MNAPIKLFQSFTTTPAVLGYYKNSGEPILSTTEKEIALLQAETERILEKGLQKEPFAVRLFAGFATVACKALERFNR